MDDESQFDTEQSLIESLTGVFTGNDKTRTGSAYHKIIEGEYSAVDGIHYAKGDGVTIAFTAAQAKPALDYRAAHPTMVHEVDIRRIYQPKGFAPIQVTGRVDGIEGMAVRDVKTKYKPVNQNEYTRSVQWKFYCDILGASEFFYDVFEVRGFPEKLPEGELVHLPKDVMVIPFDPIHCLPYDGMIDECHAWLTLFLQWVEFKNLSSYLKPALADNVTF